MLPSSNLIRIICTLFPLSSCASFIIQPTNCIANGIRTRSTPRRLDISLSKVQVDAAQSFASQVNQSLHNTILSSSSESFSSSDYNEKEQFVSFTLKGPKSPRKTKSMNEAQILKIQEEKERLRGRIKLVNGRIISLRDKKKTNESKLYLQLTVKFFGATDVAKNWNLDGNTFDFTNDLTQLIIGEGDAFTISEWGKVQQTGLNFQSAELEMSHGKLVLDMKSKAKQCKFIASKKNKKKNGMSDHERKPTITSHDKMKNLLLSPSAPFFQRLGITDSNGKPKIAKAAKLRQCQKFVEIVSNLANESLFKNDQDSTPGRKQSIITHDMGCGRGYLTFALHSHLYNRYKDQYDIQSRGVDVRPKLVKEINSIAKALGPKFDGLRFITGTIEDTTNLNDQIDILIALHACDTATDDSIWYGIQRDAKIIVTAPCCHKEVRRHLNAHINDDKEGKHPYSDILRHNIYKERIAETLTDSIRALLLEIADYDVQVFEFIGGEHTSKNVMITAIKRKKPRSAVAKLKLRRRLQSLAELHGIRQQKLALMMKEELYEEVASISKLGVKKMGMPPIS